MQRTNGTVLNKWYLKKIRGGPVYDSMVVAAVVQCGAVPTCPQGRAPLGRVNIYSNFNRQYQSDCG